MPAIRRAAIALALVLAAAIPATAEESWDLVRVGGVKVGNTHIRVERIDFEGRKLQRVTYNQVLSFRRGRDVTVMEVRYGTIETPEGSVLRLDTRIKAGTNEFQTKGDVVNGQMEMAIIAGGQTQTETIPWDADVRGPYGAEMSLARSPLKPGETRDLKLFIPGMNKICPANLKAVGRESIEMGQAGEKKSLIRVDQTITDPAGKALPELNQSFWVDDSGQILRSFSDMLPGGLFIYRTTEAAAKARNGDFDLMEATTFKVSRQITEPQRTRDIRYRVTMKEGDPTKVIPVDARQTVTSAGPKTAILQVRTVTPAPLPEAPESPGAEFLRPNPLINSEDPEVIRLTRKAVGSEFDPMRKAVAIEEWVSANLKNKNYSTAFASATEVAVSLEGDCSEHGVLAAAMCRAAGIPARVAIGMVYVEALGGFGLHLWNEVYINRRWVALDATFNQSEVDAAHIKLSDSSLDGVSPFDAFSPVVRYLNGKMTIEPIEVH